MTSAIRYTGNMGASAWLYRVLAVLLPVLVGACLAFSAPQPAYASTPFVSGTASGSVRLATAVTAKEKLAYNRVLAACMDYENQPNPIVVDVSDIGLTQTQALHVGYLLHSNGELFWINTFGSSASDTEKFGTETFKLPASYDDATITKMRKQLDAEVAKAFKRIAPGMSQALKVHVLHDYIIDRMNYGASEKTAYDGLVEGKGDCFGFARSMDLLLRRAGFEVDMAYNFHGDHAWNLVKVNGKWYHVDTTWDNGYTGKKFSKRYNWKHSRCHLYLLQSDAAMTLENKETRGTWWAHHKCTSKKYISMRDNTNSENFEKHCNDYKLYTNGFKVKGLKYKACGTKKAKLVSVVSGSKRKAKTLEVPATIKYKKVKYKIVGIGASAFANAKVRTLKVVTAKLSAASVKDSLLGSQVNKIKLTSSAKKKKSQYAKYFTLENCGKTVKVKR